MDRTDDQEKAAISFGRLLKRIEKDSRSAGLMAEQLHLPYRVLEALRSARRDCSAIIQELTSDEGIEAIDSEEFVRIDESKPKITATEADWADQFGKVRPATAGPSKVKDAAAGTATVALAILWLAVQVFLFGFTCWLAIKFFLWVVD